MKTSPTCIRLAPPDSTSRTTGSLFSSAMASARRLFFMPIGVIVPPLMALSDATIMQRTPETMPMPVTMPPPSTFFSPSSSCIRKPARVDNSSQGEPRSSSRATRSRGSNCLRARNLDSIALEVSRTRPSKPRKDSIRASICARWRANGSEPESIWVCRTGMGAMICSMRMEENRHGGRPAPYGFEDSRPQDA